MASDPASTAAAVPETMGQPLSTHALRRAVVRTVLTDPQFRDVLREAPLSAIEARFGRQRHRITVVFEQPDELTVLIPHRTEQLAEEAHRTAQLAGRTATKRQFDAILLDRAWSDPEFLAALIHDPGLTLGRLLRQYGARIPPGQRVLIRQEGPDECVIVIAKRMDDQVSDAELQRWNDATAEYDRLSGRIQGSEQAP